MEYSWQEILLVDMQRTLSDMGKQNYIMRQMFQKDQATFYAVFERALNTHPDWVAAAVQASEDAVKIS